MISKEAQEAFDKIKEDLKIKVTLEVKNRYYDDSGRLQVIVELLLKDEVIDKSEDSISLYSLGL